MLTITETALPSFTPGSAFTFTTTVSNPSTDTVTDITVTISIPVGLTGPTVVPAACVKQASSFVCTIPSLASHAQAQFLLSGTVALGTTQMTVTATATAYYVPLISAHVTVVAAAEKLALQLTNVADPTVVVNGGLLTYTYTTTNPTSTAATDTTLQIQMSVFTMEVSLPPGCTRLLTMITCVIGLLPAGSSNQIVLVTQVVGVTTNPILNTATASATGFTSAQAQSSVTETQNPPSEATVEIAILGQEESNANENIFFTLIITNTGSTTALNVVVTEAYDSNLPLAFTLPSNCVLHNDIPTDPPLSGPTIVCNYGNFGPGASTTRTDILFSSPPVNIVVAEARVFCDNPSMAMVTAHPQFANTQVV